MKKINNTSRIALSSFSNVDFDFNDFFHCLEQWFPTNCYKVIQRFRVTGLFAGQHNTKLHNCWISFAEGLGEVSAHLFSFGIIRFWREPCHCSLFNFPSIKLRPDKHNTMLGRPQVLLEKKIKFIIN